MLCIGCEGLCDAHITQLLLCCDLIKSPTALIKTVWKFTRDFWIFTRQENFDMGFEYLHFW